MSYIAVTKSATVPNNHDGHNHRLKTYPTIKISLLFICFPQFQRKAPLPFLRATQRSTTNAGRGQE